jgi:hypothetical protein
MKNETILYKDAIEKFINKYSERFICFVQNKNNPYVSMQGKKYRIKLFFTGSIYTNGKYLDYKFNEKRIVEELF